MAASAHLFKPSVILGGTHQTAVSSETEAQLSYLVTLVSNVAPDRCSIDPPNPHTLRARDVTAPTSPQNPDSFGLSSPK